MSSKKGQKATQQSAAAPTAAPTAGNSGDTVVVCACLPTDQLFNIGGGAVVRLKGVPCTHLVDMDGKPVFGKFGRTVLPREQWEQLKKIYGHMAMFQRGQVFAEKTAADADAHAAEMAETRHGMEPIAPNATQAQPVEPSEAHAAVEG